MENILKKFTLYVFRNTTVIKTAIRSSIWKFRFKADILRAEVHLKPSQTSKIELFAKIVNGFLPLTFIAKSSILDV